LIGYGGEEGRFFKGIGERWYFSEGSRGDDEGGFENAYFDTHDLYIQVVVFYVGYVMFCFALMFYKI